jgi:hypothetical protein
LNWSKKSGEILLLGLDNRDALFLQLDRSVEKLADALLVRRIASHHLLSELTSDVTLLCAQLAQLRRETRVSLFQSPQLRIGQTQSLLRKFGRALSELLLQSGAVPCCRRRHNLSVGARV